MIYDHVIMCEKHLIHHYAHMKCVGCVLDALYDVVNDLISRITKLEEKNNV